jgi:GNAT superfamily N-acetyltransferase
LIIRLTPQQIKVHQDRFVTIYRHAFHAPPYSKGEREVSDFAQSLGHHVENEGFQMVVAFEKETDEIVGFAYGYAHTPEQLFHQEVAKVIRPDIVTDWLLNSFRLVEMAVMPSAQGRGIGGGLHHHLLSGVPYQKAVLATMAAETNAYRMYRQRGWRVLLDEIFFPGVSRPYRIMGLELTGLRGETG